MLFVTALGMSAEDARGSSNSVSYGVTGCAGTKRISDADSTCMTATGGKSWDVVAMTRYYTVQSHCSDYGEVKIHVNRESAQDWLWTMKNGDKVDGSSVAKIKKFTCCIDKGDNLCFKDQVEAASNGTITHVYQNDQGHWIVGGADVATHQARYDFCQANPDYVYCDVDPQGDAKTDPATVTPTGECDGEPCTVQDCIDEFNTSPAATGSNACTVSATDFNFTAPATCQSYRASCVHDIWINGEQSVAEGSRSNAVFYASPTDQPLTADSYGDGLDIDDVSDVRYCSWQYCHSTGSLAHRWFITHGACPESVGGVSDCSD